MCVRVCFQCTFTQEYFATKIDVNHVKVEDLAKAATVRGKSH